MDKIENVISLAAAGLYIYIYILIALHLMRLINSNVF